MEQDKTLDKDYFKNQGSSEESRKKTEVFRISRPEAGRKEDLATGVFRVTRPEIMKNEDISKISNCFIPNETVSSQTISNKDIDSSVKSLYLEQNIVPTTGAFVKVKQPGMMQCNNHNAIFLPRPHNPISHQSIPGTHIQRIPVLNNTYFQLPENVPIDNLSSLANNTVRNDLNLIPIQTELTKGKSKKTTNSNESAFIENIEYTDINNNSRVRNTQNFTKETDTDAAGSQTLDRYGKDTNKLDTNLEVSENSVAKALSHPKICCEQQEPTEKNDMSVCLDIISCKTDSCSTKNNQNKNPVSESIPRNFPSTSQCLEGRNPCNTLKDYQEEDAIDLGNNKQAQVECKASNTEESEEIKAQRSKESVLKHSATNAVRKARKRTYRDAKHSNNDETIQADTEKIKKSYVITSKFAYKKSAKAQEETESKLFTKNSKVVQDIESRYMRHDLSGSTSLERVFEKKCDIINKVESEKLSKVKDHHLLKLSDKEREYLRSKCYLENDLVSDIRHRFESSHDKNNEMTKNTTESDKYSHELQVHESLGKETNHFSYSNSGNSEKIRNDNSFDDKTSSNIGRKDITNGPFTKDKPTRRSRQMGNKQQLNGQFNDHLQSLYRLKQPVVRLQHLECLPSANKQSMVIEKSAKHQTVTTNQDVTEGMSAPRKVFYVVNSNDIAKLNKPTDCTRGVTCNKNNISASPSKKQLSTGAAVTKDIHMNTLSTQSVVKTTSPHSDTTQKIVAVPSANIDKSGGQLQLESTRTFVNKKVCDNINRIQNNTVNHQKAYSNKLTVKELLEAKRDESKICSVTSRQTLEKAKRTVSLPVQLSSMKIENATSDSSMKIINSNIAVNVMALNTGLSSISRANDSQQQVLRNVIPVQTGRTIHIVNPHAFVSTSVHPQAFIASKLQLSSPDDGSKKTDKDMKPKAHSSNDVNNIVSCRENNDKNPAYFKIGDQTVIIKRSEDKNRSKRKTLPAPKSKRTIADDYKRSRRRSRDRFTQRMHRKSLGSNLKKIIKESDNTVFKMMYLLDLIPVEILKKLSNPDRESDSELDTTIKNAICQHTNFGHETEETYLENYSFDRCRHRERKTNECNGSEYMANVIQIIKLEDESVTFSIKQINVHYRKLEPDRNKTSFANVGTQCRLKFSADGIIEKMYVENLDQGLYLVKNTNGDKIKLANRQKMNTCLVPYPPYIHTIPVGSLSIAVGELFLEQQKSQYIFKDEDKNVQSLLHKFLYPLTALKNIDDFLDKRYCSITDKSMSPRCSSPMFYSQEMKNAFDDFIEDGVVASEGSRNNLSRRSETNFTKLDLQTTRFSERAMALKIKQNELFESCRKLKSENTVKVGSKKKKDKRLLAAAPRMENLKTIDDGGVKVLNNPRDVMNREKCYSNTQKETTSLDDKIIDVDA